MEQYSASELYGQQRRAISLSVLTFAKHRFVVQTFIVLYCSSLQDKQSIITPLYNRVYFRHALTDQCPSDFRTKLWQVVSTAPARTMTGTNGPASPYSCLMSQLNCSASLVDRHRSRKGLHFQNFQPLHYISLCWRLTLKTNKVLI